MAIPDEVVQSECFQQFLTVLTPAEQEKKWNKVRDKVMKRCLDLHQDGLDLALALAKYEMNGSPSNWNSDDEQREDMIRDWCDWCLQNSSPDRIKSILSQYRRGLIPDAFEEMIEFFC